MAIGSVLVRGTSARVEQTADAGTTGQVLTSNGAGAVPTFQDPAVQGSWIPLVDGSEPPVFITDGAGVLILVAYP